MFFSRTAYHLRPPIPPWAMKNNTRRKLVYRNEREERQSPQLLRQLCGHELLDRISNTLTATGPTSISKCLRRHCLRFISRIFGPPSISPPTTHSGEPQCWTTKAYRSRRRWKLSVLLIETFRQVQKPLPPLLARAYSNVLSPQPTTSTSESKKDPSETKYSLRMCWIQYPFTGQFFRSYATASRFGIADLAESSSCYTLSDSPTGTAELPKGLRHDPATTEDSARNTWKC
ncbi:hypothetical protein BJ322DRAFT_337795 [Thelephora terrestris]|uniref:Uncharacterized protein n=1 Tax=Thelephora terrestris TaxID=56493 RepID=A0A9P6H868_9AGAM|nr:hypothetical protein BJ322DRAFT_337795 [Thelephora terrestris]